MGHHPSRHLPSHVFEHFGCGGRRVSAPNRSREKRLEVLDVLEGRTKVVPPLGDAVSLIHNDGRHVPMFVAREKQRMFQALRREVQELGFSESDVVQNAVAVVSDPGFRANALAPQRLALILHQGDEGSHDKAKATAGQCGELKAQAFAAPGGQQGKRVAPRMQIQHRPRLVGPQPVKAPVPLEEGTEFFRDDG